MPSLANILVWVGLIVGYFYVLWKIAEAHHRETNWWEYDDEWEYDHEDASPPDKS